MKASFTILAPTLLLAAGTALGQPGSLRFETQPYPAASGSFAHTAAGESAETVFTHLVEIPGVPFFRVHFGECSLGKASYITLTSRADADWQILNARSLPIWSNSSGYFVGDAVEVELHVAPGDKDVFIEIIGVTFPLVTDPTVTEGGPRTLCDFDDDRVASSDERVARLSFNCTAWFTINTAFMAAGHCTVHSGDTLEFNVPQSMPNGVIRPAAMDDQYPVLPGTISFENDGIGSDWSVFGVGRNSNTDLYPWQVQSGFVRVTRATPGLGDTVRVTGYGLDHTPAGSSAFCCREIDGNCIWNDCNSRNQTLQTDTGYFGAGTGTSHMYRVDTEPANSGSPILWVANGHGIGIHTTGSCSPFSGNQGTSFENDALIDALEDFLGSNTVYADSTRSGAGSVFNPYGNIQAASVLAPSGAQISFTAGSYSGGAVFARPARLIAPIGLAALGQ